MLDPQALIKRVDRYLRRELKAALPGSARILSITIPVQEIHLRSLPEIRGNWFYLDRPCADERILGLGEAVRITASGPDRLQQLDSALQQIHADWDWIDLELTGFHPLVYTCFAFSPEDRMQGSWQGMPNSGLFLPRLTLQQRDNLCTATFSADLGKQQDPDSIHRHWMGPFADLVAALNQPHQPPGAKTSLARIATSSSLDQWQLLVTKAQAEITSKALEKVVPARHLQIQAQRRLDPGQLMSTLNYLYPSSMLLATHLSGRVFVSATPERLASCNGNSISCDAVAGTIRRSAIEQNDLNLGKSLLADPKVRHEHQLVVEDISHSLKPLCSALSIREFPTLKRLRNLQHLWTEIQGQLKPGVSLLQAAAAIHPTAAVNGHPGDAAGAWLRQNEPFERGWYAGVAGWIDCSGRGELAVLLRCALLEDDRADLFAGAGITAGSDADDEFAETELKFGVMLEALENS
jgi:isochorismate synthase